MDAQLQELLDKIKSEGVDAAEQQSKKIIQEAEEKARKIVSGARSEADSIREKAESEAERREQAGKAALEQAGRDLVIGLKKRLHRIFKSVMEEKTAAEYSGDVLRDAIVGLFGAWNPDIGEMTLQLPEKEYEKLEQSLRKALAEKISSGIEIHPSGSIKAGFRVTVEGGAAYYSFTETEVAEVLAGYLNPALAETLKNADFEE